MRGIQTRISELRDTTSETARLLIGLLALIAVGVWALVLFK
jgi:hypothetical protein